jgi:hypothetical protein
MSSGSSGESSRNAGSGAGSKASPPRPARNVSQGNTGASATAKDVLKALPGKSGKTGPIKHVPDQTTLDDLFKTLTREGETMNPGTYPGQVKRLPDGTIVRMRDWSSRTHDATIDVTLPDGTYIKVHIKP